MIKKLWQKLFPPEPEYLVRVQLYGHYAGRMAWVEYQPHGPYKTVQEAYAKRLALLGTYNYVAPRLRVIIEEVYR